MRLGINLEGKIGNCKIKGNLRVMPHTYGYTYGYGYGYGYVYGIGHAHSNRRDKLVS